MGLLLALGHRAEQRTRGADQRLAHMACRGAPGGPGRRLSDLEGDSARGLVRCRVALAALVVLGGGALEDVHHLVRVRVRARVGIGLGLGLG